MSAKSITTALLVVFGILIVLVIGTAVALVKVDPRPLAERYVSKMLDRQVRIGSLTIHWGDPLHIEIGDLRLANAQWGSVPDMLRVEHLTADVDAKALWSGLLRYQHLTITKPVLVLERNPEGIGNWRFEQASRTPQPNQEGGMAVVPKNRRQFPSLLDFRLREGLVTYRTYSGHVLRIRLDDVTIGATGDNAFVDVEAKGAYNDADIRLKGQTQSFGAMRDATVPFGTTFSLRRQSAKLDFTGTMREPLDFEGVQGPIRITTDKLSDILSIFHMNLAADPAATLTADLSRQGNLWNLMDGKGNIASSNFKGKLMVLEGNRGATDDISTDLSFDQLNLNKLLSKDTGDDAEKKSSAKGWTELSLQTPAEDAPRVAAKIAAKQMTYGNIQIGDLFLDGKAGPGDVTLNETRFSLANSQFYMGGALKPDGDGSRLSASLSLEDGKIERFINLLFGESADVQGRIDGKAVINLRGSTLGEGLKNSNGALVLSVTEGQIARALLEKIATDLRALFRRGKGTAKISCMLGVMQLKNGMGTIESFKLRTPEANLNGEGRIDLSKQSIDLFLQSEADSTGFFALDVPLQISGNWKNPKIRTASKSVPKQGNVEEAEKLPASLRQLVDGNRCNRQ